MKTQPKLKNPRELEKMELGENAIRIMKMLESGGSALVNFAKSGFPPTDIEALNVREAICKSCDLWDPSAFGGTGRCNKCGCSTWAKLRMATEKCPLDKW